MAVSSKLSDLIAATSLSGGDLIYVAQGSDSRHFALAAIGAQLLGDTGPTAARATLELGDAAVGTIGTTVQAYDDDLAAIAALTSAANKAPYATGAGAWAMMDVTAAARGFLDDTGSTTQRASLGLTIGTDVQAYDAGLASIAALTTAADRMIYTTALDTYAVTTLTPFARTILDDTGATKARTTLGITQAVHVTWYGPVDTGSAQTTIVAAVADANTNGYDLYWPAGTYVSTATIANFHDVNHFGPGIIERVGLGDELIINGGFASSSSWTVAGTGWSIGAGVATCTAGAAFAGLYQDLDAVLTAGETYEITYTVTSYTSGDVRIRLAIGSTVHHNTTLRSAAATYTEQITVTQAIDRVYFSVLTAGSTLSVDNLTIRKVNTQFAVAPKEGQTNTLYVAQSGGSDSNDGLSSSQALATTQKAYDIITDNYWPLNGKWAISHGAGTYSSASQRVARLGPSNSDMTADGVDMKNAITIYGPIVGYDASTNPEPVPVAIFDAGAAAAIGFQLERGVKALVKDIKFQNYSGSASSAGLSADGNCWVRTENVHAESCTLGVSANNHSILDMKGGAITSCTTGIRSLFNTKHEIGNQSAGAVGQGPFIRSCTTYGFQAQEGATGHSDYVTYEDNATGVYATVNARVNLNGSTFKRNTVAVRVQDANVFPDGVNWNMGGADANTEILRFMDGGVLASENATFWRELDAELSPTTSSLATETTVATFNIDTYKLSSVPSSIYPGKAIKVRAAGTITGTDNTKAFRVRLAGTLLAGATIEADANGGYIFEAETRLLTSTSQATGAKVEAGIGTNRVKVGVSTSAVNTVDTGTLPLTFTVQCADTGDLVATNFVSVELKG